MQLSMHLKFSKELAVTSGDINGKAKSGNCGI